jgi:cytosine/adenosine deaminase-related metal-dependent hydrolase
MMNDRREELRGGDVLIEGNIIKQVGKNLSPGRVDRVISGKGKILLPGFVNTHHHLYQVLTRCLPSAQDANLFEWLTNLYPVWAKLSPHAVYVSARAAIGELLLTGCTTTTDMFYLFPTGVREELIDEEIRAAAEMGIRFHPCRGAMCRGKSKGGLPPDEVVQTEDKVIADCQRLIECYHEPRPFAMCRIALAPCSPFSVSEDLMRECLALARDRGVRCHTHIAETADEERYCLDVYGCRPLAYLERLGWLGEDIWLAHCVHLSDEEVQLLAQARTGVAHCPTSNLRLGSGIAPVPKMLRSKVKVGLGVDGASSNDSSNMLAELHMCLLVHRVGTGATAMPARVVLWMATRGGAQVLGWDELGSIEEGKAADLVMFDISGLEYAGTQRDPVGALLFCGISQRVHTSIINGRIVVQDGHLVEVDEQLIRQQADEVSRLLLC